MPDALARARAMECEKLAENSQPESAKHYHLIAKHYLAVAHLEEDQIAASEPEEDAFEQKDDAPAD